MSRKRTREDWAVDIVNTVLLCLIAIVTLYPFYYTLVVSFNSGTDTNLGGIYIWPRKFTFDNYAYFLRDPQWIEAFFVTVLRTLAGTVLGVLFTSLVGYGLAKKDLLFRKVYVLAVIFAMNFSGGLIAYYVVLRSLGLLNTFAVYVVPTMLSLFFLLIAISFFQEVPSELGESARIDGAGEVLIFARIVLPISMPLLATMSLFLGSSQWNSWLDSAYFVRNEHLRTLAFRMMQVINETIISADDAQANMTSAFNVTPFSVQTTAMIISIAPIVCVYPFLQKYFVKGMLLGSVKG